MRTYPVGCPRLWQITMKIYINVDSNFRVHCGWPDCGGTRMAFLTRFGFVYHISINLQPSMNYKQLQHIEQHKESETFQVDNLLFVNTSRPRDTQTRGVRRYKVFDWIAKHLRYMVLGQKPCRYTVFNFCEKNVTIPFIEYGIAQFWATFFLCQVHVSKGLTFLC